MAYPLGLKLYTLANRREAAPATRPPRPEGRLVWLNAPDADAARPLLELARRLIDEEGANVLLTGPEVEGAEDVILQPPPLDTPAEARAFLDHWRPDAGIFADGEMRPALTHEAAMRRVPLMLVDGRSPVFPKGQRNWWPGLMRGVLDDFRYILTLDESAARSFRRAGASAEVVKVAGRMEEGSHPLACTEAERAELSRTIATRPVWLAIALPEDEEEAVIAAHRAALRLSHRLLLIVVPEHPERAAALADRFESENFPTARRALDEDILPETEVYVADNPAEYGLWLRLAPVSYLGGSFSSGTRRDPMEAAALGSAILHGPQPGRWGGIFARLAAQRATLPVAQPKALGDAVCDLLAPDRVAWLAQAAWGVASDGTEVTDRVLDLIQRMMEGE